VPGLDDVPYFSRKSHFPDELQGSDKRHFSLQKFETCPDWGANFRFAKFLWLL
jgi:hypothetical protein